MKRPFSRRQRGIAFTLVEMLVVIAIIAILIAVIGANVSNVLRFAKRTKANSNAVQIQTAVMSYYQEYGVYPTVSGAATNQDAYYDGGTGGAANWGALMEALCGNVNPGTGAAVTGSGPGTVSNTRGIAYLQPTHGDLNTTSGIGILANPFGASATTPYFYMVIDTDYSGVVGDTSTTKLPDFSQNTTNYLGATLANGIPGGVAVWCPCDQPLVGTSTTTSNPNFWAHTY